MLDRILDEAQARQLPALIAEWSEATDERRWIARALRIDLALLTARPELVIPALYRRCAFAGAAAEGIHYATRPEPPADFAALRTHAVAWATRAPRPWLRALRPPGIPLDGAVIEEYRTSARGTLWASADGEQLGVDGEGGRVAWERATGRRVEGAPASPTAHAGWVKDSLQSGWGRLVLARGAQRLEIALGSEQIVREVYPLTDELVLAVGDELDYDHFAWLVDTRRAEVRWRLAEGARSAALAGDTVVIGHPHGITTYALATGAPVSAFQCPYPDQLLLLADGTAATRAGDVIRIWSIAEATARAQVTHHALESWTDAAFSPDGTRLVTGTLLCDARTGELVAHLACDGPSGWLEGGPPRGCHGLVDGLFAEILPSGLSLWDSRDGRKIHFDRERRGRTRDLAAWDPTGKVHALWSDRGPLQIFQLREGTRVAALDEPPADRFDRRLAFTADGAHLIWEAGGERRAVAVAAPTAPYAIGDELQLPVRVEIAARDGVLVVGEAAVPYDEPRAVASPDGRSFAYANSHVALQA